MDTGDGPFDPRDLQVAVTGNGNPRAALTPLRTCLLRALLEGPTEPKLERSFGLRRETLRAELRSLERWGLVTRRGGRSVPTFLVVTAAEGQRVAARAARSASLQFDHLSARWPELAGIMQLLNLPNIGLGELAFLLVGNWLLDQSLLEALEQEGSLMPPAPSRPAPGDDEAHYYLWLVEGDYEHRGRYGQRLTPLREGVPLVTFGEYIVAGQENFSRTALEAHASELAASDIDTPQSIAQALGVPLLTEEVMRCWLDVAYPEAETLVERYKRESAALQGLFGSLAASRYLPRGMGEFMCWYDHLTYARTLDLLAERGYLEIPATRFAGALWELPASV